MYAHIIPRCVAVCWETETCCENFEEDECLFLVLCTVGICGLFHACKVPLLRGGHEALREMAEEWLLRVSLVSQQFTIHNNPQHLWINLTWMADTGKLVHVWYCYDNCYDIVWLCLRDFSQESQSASAPTQRSPADTSEILVDFSLLPEEGKRHLDWYHARQCPARMQRMPHYACLLGHLRGPCAAELRQQISDLQRLQTFLYTKYFYQIPACAHATFLLSTKKRKLSLIATKT